VRVHEPDADRDVVGVALVADRNGAGQVGQLAAGAVVEDVRLEVGHETLVLLHHVDHVDARGLLVLVLAIGKELLEFRHLIHLGRLTRGQTARGVAPDSFPKRQLRISKEAQNRPIPPQRVLFPLGKGPQTSRKGTRHDYFRQVPDKEGPSR